MDFQTDFKPGKKEADHRRIYDRQVYDKHIFKTLKIKSFSIIIKKGVFIASAINTPQRIKTFRNLRSVYSTAIFISAGVNQLAENFTSTSPADFPARI